ncbi:pyridoxal phosphate-dependent aminotransferase [candidate division NPL-UPA2 bacterium Unc8]|uniref:Aminotransferase n=1 Tax=candidate division NPL-UPA2 bacterium Unc8 TaxID=1980939 RepID=A0A399G0I1_UNCN2|nr:MAG: pyridoxal phosphate-dependent aminotransferase [candidate division NPL-UPA2 bacterium Unc8]
MSLAKKITSIKPSLTLAITAKAKAMRDKNVNVIGFGAGEPDFDTPVFIKQAAKKAMDAGFTKYTPTSGILELKKAICDKFVRDNDLNYELGEIIISCGAKHSLYNAIQAICEEGDEVILPAPYWVSYPEQIKLAGATPIIVQTSEENGFKLKGRAFSESITRKTKALILNSPNNPTGAVYSKEELSSIAAIAMEKGIYIISDEIYEKIIYDAEHVSIAALSPQIKNLTILINGVSKSYSMTGWRIGYAAANKEIVAAMSGLQDHSTSNPSSISQWAAVAAISGDQSILREMVVEFRKRRDYIVQRLSGIDGVSCLQPDGAFYFFLNVSGLFGKTFNGQMIMDSILLTELLLTEAKVAVVPGSAFGSPGHIRLSFATSMSNITSGLNRIEMMLKQLS